jgi:hypothetical protein
MADNAFISSSSGMSNGQQGTRGLSAGDWVRLKRLQGAKTYQTVNLNTNKDIAPTNAPQVLIHNTGAISVFDVVGTSKIRRTASNWIDYKASQVADYVLTSQRATTGTSVTNTRVKLCDCSSTTLSTKNGTCTKCNSAFTHVRIM